LFNWLLAKKTNGKFIVRVEDTDEARSTKESEASILNDLKWLQLDWDEGPEVDGPHAPYRQSERKHIYAKAAEQLIAEGKAYRCFATEEEMEVQGTAPEQGAETAEGRVGHFRSPWRDAKEEDIQARLKRGDPYAVRFKVPSAKVVTILDKVRGIVSWETDAALLGDFVIMRSNGMPVYNFCVSVDDADMRITHVVRAEEHLSNTLRQMLVLEALRVKPPTYAHCSLILGSDRSKLSKRHGATSVTQFSQQGFVPEAMLNYLAKLGWNDGTDKEIYTPAELCAAFSLEQIVKSAAVFDMDKLRWINAQHLRLRTAEQMRPVVLRELCTGTEAMLPASYVDPTQLPAERAVQFDNFMRVATMIAQRDMEVTTDSKQLVARCLEYDMAHTLATDAHVEEILAADSFGSVLNSLVADFESGAMPQGGEANFPELWKAYMKDLGKRLNLKGKALFHPVRLCMTGRVSGPDVGDQMQLILFSEGLLDPAYATRRRSVSERMAFLRSFDTSKALAEVKASRAAATVPTA
jgi:glutamyl-tRNA synthetase